MTSSESACRSLREVLAPFDLRLAILFGSMARGTAGAHSDVDVAVLDVQPLSAVRKIEIMEAIALAFGRPVDLVDLSTAGEPVLGSVVTEGVTILGAAVERGRLLNRHLVEQADFVPLQNRILETRRRAWINP